MTRARSIGMLIAGAAAGFLLAAPVAAQDPGSRQTRDFVQAAAQSDQFEILEAQSALSASRNPDLLAFARMMIHDHQRTSASLMAAAARSGLKPPAPGIASDQSMFLAALQSRRGEEFDKAYAKQQMLAHRSALAVQRSYAQSGDDANVRKTAVNAVPVIEAHAKMADRLAARLSAP